MRALVAGAFFLLAAGTAGAQSAPSGMGLDDARHLLARTGFGPTQAELQAWSGLTRAQAVDRLLDGAPTVAALAPPEWTAEAITPRSVIRATPREELRAVLLKETQQNNRRTAELRAWWVGEMLSTQAPLVERMTLFWHNHFTSSQQKVRFPQLMYQQNVLLREHALGNFASLLHAVSKDPAMVVYLDSATNRRGRPNENFAREVMELFTLGEGHYTETDIREAARAFTGWSIDTETGDFIYRRPQHDTGQKTVLGRTGRFDGDQVLDILLEQPRTAEYVVEKLWREFVSPDPDRAEVRRIAGLFRDSGYEISAALRGLFMSPAFWAEDNRAVLVKSPVEFVVGMLRQFDMPVDNPLPVALTLASLGQNLFAPPNVKGWPGGEAWINSATLLARKQFAERLFRTEESMRPVATTKPIPADMARETVMNEARRPQPARPAQQPFVTAGGFTVRGPQAVLPVFQRRWFSNFAGDRDPAVEQLVLAAAPANPAPEDVTGREWARHLTMDPVYQLK